MAFLNVLRSCFYQTGKIRLARNLCSRGATADIKLPLVRNLSSRGATTDIKLPLVRNLSSRGATTDIKLPLVRNLSSRGVTKDIKLPLARNLSSRGATADIKLPLVRNLSSRGATTDIKLPLSYQKDITQDNLSEIIQVMRSDSTYVNNDYNSEPIFRAITAMSDRPWWTCRDASGTILGFYYVSRDVANRFVVGNSLYVKPEARKYGIGIILYLKIFEAMVEEPACYYRAWYGPGGENLGRKIHQLNSNKEKDVTVRRGVPEYDPALLEDRIRKELLVVPYCQDLSFSDLVGWDKFLAWDTGRVYGAPRPAYWKVLLNSPSVNAYLALDRSTREIKGFGVIQPSFDTDCMIIGPLYGEDTASALTVLKSLFQHYGAGKRMMVTHYADNQPMKEFFDAIGMPALMRCPLYSTEPDRFPVELTKQMFLGPSNSANAQ